MVMLDMDDMALVKAYADTGSEEAFAILVSRHLNLAYSTALRQVRNTAAAEDVSQAVFIILSKKAKSLRSQTILPAWLYRTARHVASDALKSELRRQRREKEAHVDNLQPTDGQQSAWRMIAPLLDDALAALGDKERDAIILRFLEGRKLNEVGTTLGIAESAAGARVARALEKMRKFFARRGVVLSVAGIAAATSAGALHGAPVQLATAVTSTAIGTSTATASTLGLTNSAMKLMAWTKAKVAMAGIAAALGASVVTVAVIHGTTRLDPSRSQVLTDGSVLILTRVVVDTKAEFGHRRPWPGLFKMGTRTNFTAAVNGAAAPERVSLGFDKTRTMLFAEFKLTGTNLSNNPLVKPAFSGECRYVLHGEGGMEFVADEFSPAFQDYADGCFGYVDETRFPRTSRWLGIRIEKRDRLDRYGPWQAMADFKVPNPAYAVVQSWTAGPATTNIDRLDFTLGDATAELGPLPFPKSNGFQWIWNSFSRVPFTVQRNGVGLTNWTAARIDAIDAIGNWRGLGSLTPGSTTWSLDPRYVWKLSINFEPGSDYPAASIATANLPLSPGASVVTNVAGVPITFSCSKYRDWRAGVFAIGAQIPTNRTDLAIREISVRYTDGTIVENSGPGPGSDQFTIGHVANALTAAPGHGWIKRNYVTFVVAVVPNIHATFFTRPHLIKPNHPDAETQRLKFGCCRRGTRARRNRIISGKATKQS